MFKPNLDGIITDTVGNKKYRVLGTGADCSSIGTYNTSACHKCSGKIVLSLIEFEDILTECEDIQNVCIWANDGELYRTYEYKEPKSCDVPIQVVQSIL